MSLLDLYPQEIDNLMEQATAHGFDPRDTPAGFFQGIGTGALSGIQTGLARQDYAVDPERRDETVQKLIDLRPDPRTVGTAGQILNGMLDPLTVFVGSMADTFHPLLAAGQTADITAKSQEAVHKAEGLDAKTARDVATWEGIFAGAGTIMPAAVPGKLLTRALSGGAIMSATGVPSRYAIQQTLENAGYHDMAAQYEPFTVRGVLTDFAIGMAFGGLLGPRAREAVRPSQIDAALTASQAAHAEIDTAPGFPTDAATRAAHADNLERATAALLEGRDFTADAGVTDGSFVDNPTRPAFVDDMTAAVDEHLGPDFRALTGELEARGLPTDLNLYSLDERAPVRFTDRVRGMLDRYEQTGDAGAMMGELRQLRADLEQRVADNQAKGAADRQRGELYVRERLMRAERQGDITPEQHELARWLLDQNPRLADDLAVSIRSSNGMASGQYNPTERLVSLFKTRGDDMTAAHEVLHHAERMMPDDVRQGVMKEWMDGLQQLHDTAAEAGDTNLLAAIDDALRAAAGDTGAFNRIANLITDGKLPKDFYQWVNPSEYWAVNAARLVRERASAGGWVAKAVQWMRELLRRVQSAFGINSRAAIIRGLNAVLEGNGELSGQMLTQSARELYSVDSGTPGSSKGEVERMLRRSAENENRTGVVVGGRPGEFGWSIVDKNSVPPPIQHPVQRGPRLEKIAPAVRSILGTAGFKKLAQEVAGIDGLKVDQIEGTWLGNPEPSFSIHGKNLSEAGAGRLARMLGFGFAQDATVVTKHSPDLAEGVPTVYVGGKQVLQEPQLRQIMEAAREHGLDLSTSADKKAVKFLYFGDEAGLDEFHAATADIADRVGLDALSVMTQGDLYEAGSYLEGENFGVGGEARDQTGSFGSPGVFGRIVDHVIVPYARAVAAEGYRLSPDRLAERFGLSDGQRELIREKLRPRDGEARSTVPLMTGEETLDVQPTSVKGKNKTVGITDIMWALQNRAARLGQIEPGDYSDQALKVIAKAIAAEVRYHVAHSEKSAIGWYDAALKKAKSFYLETFPELGTDPDKGLLFDAVLGITSQGNDVFANSQFAARVYQLMRDGQSTLSDAVKMLAGTFGDKTKAIELNLLKLEHLLDTNGYARMRELFNKTMTVSEWNARLRSDTSLFGPDGKPLSVEGAAPQKVTGWMVFGPKIGSFINNLHGDYSTLTADLWFSRTWNRLLGYMFQHAPEKEAKQYQEFKDALQAEHEQSQDVKIQNGKPVMKDGKPVPWENGRDIVGMSREDLDALINDPQKMLDLAVKLEERYRVGVDFQGNKLDKSGYKIKSDLRRRAKNWIESREDPLAAPRSDLERDFQQRTVEAAQKLIKRETGMDITVADIQAALWFHEKELFGKLGATDKRSAPADYADAAHHTLDLYRQGNLYYVPTSKGFIGGENGRYLGMTIASETGGEVSATKALDLADAEIAQAERDSQGYDAAVACELRGGA